MELSHLTAISPVDGRYGARTASLRNLFSEYGLIHKRVTVEIRWLQFLANSPEFTALSLLSPAANLELEAIIRDFSPGDAGRIKELEKTTNHDVKAVEYFIREKIRDDGELRPVSEFVHFACTSEDINNLSQARILAAELLSMRPKRLARRPPGKGSMESPSRARAST